MKKSLLSLLLSLVASSSLLAQELPPSNSGSDTTVAPSQAPVQHLQATYNIASKQAKPMVSVTWVADLKNDTAPYSYNVTVTLQNDTDKIFGTWSLALIFLGSITTPSPEVSVRGYMFSDGPAPGYTIFEGIQAQGTMDLSPHGSITFSYTYQLPVTQQTIEAPAKIRISYVMTPTLVATAPSADAAPANP